MKNFECNILANDKQWLYTEYIIKQKSIREISKKCNVCDDTIQTRLKRFSIPIRGHKESNKISGKTYKRRSPTKEEREKTIKKLRTGSNIFCVNCGKYFYITKGNLKKRKYCSKNCHYEYIHNHINRNQDWRDYPEYDIWRKLVYKRDNWKCKICNSKININAHHIFEGNNFPNLRFEVYNGITLCEKHHVQIHKHTSSFIQECIKQTPNIGETPEMDNPEASIKKYLLFLIRSNDYQGESRTD